MDRPIAVVTDSTADIPDDLLTSLDIHSVPLSVNIDGHTYLDRVEMTPDQFYPLLTAAAVQPTTSQPAPGAFEEVYRHLLDAGKHIVSVHLSGKLSGTLRSAQIARETLMTRLAVPPGAIHLFDSLSATMGLGWQVLAAAEAAVAGKTAAEIMTILEKARTRVQLVVSLETLEYLRRGGRIGAVKAFLGSLLNFKPMLQVVDGVPVPMARPRSKGQVIQKYLEIVETREREAARLGHRLKVAIVHAHALDEAIALKEELMRRFHFDEDPMVVPTGPVLGLHTGPGTIGVALFDAV